MGNDDNTVDWVVITLDRQAWRYPRLTLDGVRAFFSTGISSAFKFLIAQHSFPSAFFFLVLKHTNTYTNTYNRSPKLHYVLMHLLSTVAFIKFAL